MRHRLLALCPLFLLACSGNHGDPNLDAPLVVSIVLENQDYAEVVGSANAPYINSLISQYGLATNYSDSGTHPSLPNYLYMISGDTQYQGGIDLDPNGSLAGVDFPVKKNNLGHQLQSAGIKWRSYQESAGMPCVLLPTGNYVPRHDPFLFFDDIQNGSNNLCANTNVDYSEFAADLALGTYRYMWITPNLLDDGHNPPDDPVTGLMQADAWCQSEIPKIIASAEFQARGILFLTWDEAEGRNGDPFDQIPMIIVSPLIASAGMQSSVAYTHASFLATVEDLFHLSRLGAAVTAMSMSEFLTIPPEFSK